GFYQQTRWYDENIGSALAWRLECPLAVFLGSKVATQDSDVAAVIAFLARAARDANWFAGQIDRVLAVSGVQQTLNGDPLDFEFLRSLKLDSMSLARDVALRVFGGSGGFVAARINDNEIGLRSAGATADHYFGVVNVGEAKKVHEALIQIPGVADADGDKLTGSLFASIDRRPSVKILIGAKRFIEGWSSWRVAAMGLINVGKSEGSQIVQMFGRGVRLLGKHGHLKRSSAQDREAPPVHLPLLERLLVFGIKADYMQRFLESLEREGARRQVIEVPVTIRPDFDFLQERLRTLQCASDFSAHAVIFQAARAPKITLPVINRIAISAGLEHAQSVDTTAALVHAVHAGCADIEAASLYAQQLRLANGWANYAIPASDLTAYFATKAFVQASPDYFHGAEAGTRRRSAVLAIAEKVLGRVYRDARSAYEFDHLAELDLNEDDANFPTSASGGERRLAYRLEIEAASQAATAGLSAMQSQFGAPLSEEDLAQIRAVLERAHGLVDVASAIGKLIEGGGFQSPADDLSAPLPRLHIPEHLYAPLLIHRPVRVTAGQLDFDFDGVPALGFRATPPLLNDGEARFVWDVREFWKAHHDYEEYRDCRVFLLRNLPHVGVGLFRSQMFYPDFLLWLKRGKSQVLAFIDPKGILLDNAEEKIHLLHQLQLRSFKVPLRGFVVSTTPLDAILAARPEESAQALRAKGVLMQSDPTYIRAILDTMKAAL
ncbi:MAG: hypothetical protein JNJ55_00420, partial [Betaproteobacteria bacterium]|nr:hypothetical protein [Betaproteobacteria bacterium]